MPTTLVATPEPGNSPPRVLLELEWTGATQATIVRTDPDGRQRAVRSGAPAALTGGLWTGYDYESWFGESTVYEAQVGVEAISSPPVTLDVSVPWLRHVGSPSLSMAPEIDGDGSPAYALTRAVFSPIGRAYPIVVTDGRRHHKVTTLSINTWTLAERQALLDLLADGSVLLYDVPPSLGWGITHAFIAPGDLTETRQVETIAGIPYRNWSLPYEVVDTPAAGSTMGPPWTYAAVLTGFSSYAEVLAEYASYADLLANIPIGTTIPPVPPAPDGDAEVVTYTPDAAIPTQSVYGVVVNTQGSFVYSTYDEASAPQPHWGKFTTWSQGPGSSTVTINTNFDITNVLVRPLIQNITPTVVNPRQVKLTISRTGDYSVEFNGNPLQTDQTKPGSTDQLDPLFLFVSPLEDDKPDPDDPDVYAYFPGGAIYTGNSVVPGNGSTVTVPSSGDLVVPSGKRVYIEGGAYFKGRIICGATSASGSECDDIHVDGRGIVDATWQAIPGNPIKLYKCSNSTFKHVIALSCNKWAFRVFGCGATGPVTVTNPRILSWADPAKTGTPTPDGIDVIASQDVVIDAPFVRSRDDGISFKNYKNSMDGNWSGDCQDNAVRNFRIWNGDAGNGLEIGYETGPSPNVMTGITFEHGDIIHKTTNPANPDVAVDYQRGALTVHNQGTGGDVTNILFDDIRVEDVIGDAGVYTAGKDGTIYINSHTTSAQTDGIAFRDISIVRSQAALATQVRGGDSTHRIVDVTFENVVINGTLISDSTVAAANGYVSSNVTNVQWLPGQGAGPTGIILNPVADAWVQNNATQSGTDQYLKVKNSASNNLDRTSYLMFDTTATGLSSCTAATLRLWKIGNDKGIATPITVYEVIDDSWTETGVTWTNAPALGTLIVATPVGSQQMYYEWDVTGFVNAELAASNFLISFGLWNATQADNLVTFNAREAVANIPQLAITP